MTATRNRDGPWLDLVAGLLTEPVTSWPAETVVRLLVETFDAVGGAYYRPHPDGTVTQIQRPAELFAAHREEIERWGVHDAPRAHPILRYYLATGSRAPMQVVDVPTRFADARIQAQWREWCGSFHDGDVASQLALPVGVGPAPSTSLLIGRSAALTVPEMETAARLQRLLVGLDRQITAYARWSRRAGPQGADEASAVGLTPRELAVLELLATGRTARLIARRLAVAERTVQKHLQRVYAKLRVSDRLGAVQRAQQLGLLPPAGST